MGHRRRRLLHACWSGALSLLALGAVALPASSPGYAASASPGGATSTGQAAAAGASVHNDTSAPLRTLPDTGMATGFTGRHAPFRLPRPAAPAPAAPTATSAASIPATTQNFDGVGQGFTGPQGTFSVQAAPPDTNGAAGPKNFVEIANTSFAVFDKTGGVQLGPKAVNTLWSGFGGLCQTNNDGDPVVRY